ncbi:hypothetical protein NLJ89_g10598 [Agrocybe chaxingu]|uniref:Uncharacterized protein n=1 Tax=Agrocybe chaxingu TaxID=84603 RepID=A0A9W8JYC7_9AGAR|nr:hypothetical protein NLJ89_g10598 [Agrocybe chaxingu]
MSPIRSRKRREKEVTVEEQNKSPSHETRRHRGTNPLSTLGRTSRKQRRHQQFMVPPVKTPSDSEEEIEVERIVSSPASMIEEEAAPPSSPIQDPPPSSSPLSEISMNSSVKGHLTQGSGSRYSPNFVSAREMMENRNGN